MFMPNSLSEFGKQVQIWLEATFFFSFNLGFQLHGAFSSLSYKYIQIIFTFLYSQYNCWLSLILMQLKIRCHLWNNQFISLLMPVLREVTLRCNLKSYNYSFGDDDYEWLLLKKMFKSMLSVKRLKLMLQCMIKYSGDVLTISIGQVLFLNFW